MPTQWSTFPIEFSGGLISNLTPLQQGVSAVGSATILQNFEVNKEGGYTKLKGYAKFNDTEVPGDGPILGIKAVASSRAVVARKMDTATVTEYQTATSTVNGSNTYTVTFQSVSGSNKYFIGGSQQPTLDLIEGATYTFNYPSAHPFRFSTTTDGTHTSGGAEYTTGVTHVSSTQTTITVASGAPTLYYYCSQHAGMGGQINTNTNTGAVSLDNNRATAIVNGATTSTANVTVDRVRPFTAVTGTASANGTSATFDVTNTSGTYSATVNAGGSDYAVNETVTIVGANLGGTTTANDATVTVTGVAASVLYNSAAYTYAGDGTGLVINVTRSGGSYSVAIANAGTGGYKVGETLTVAGTALGGATTANDATVTVNSVTSVSKTYTNPTQSAYGGSGSSGTFNVTRGAGISQTTNYAVTVVNVGGVNVFALDGVATPTLSLVEGTTYTFDVSDSTVAGHPLAFKDSGGSAYTTGVTTTGTAGTSGATVTIAVPTSGTMPARYYCTVHGNAMGNTISTVSATTGIYTVAISAAGSGYAAGETITIVGTQLGGATTANDATITITAVDGSGAITAATIAGTAVITGSVATASIAGTAVTTGPITGISIAGTGADFGTITRGMVVTGTGITGTVTVKTVTNQNSIILDTAVSLADNAVLSFITNIKVGMFVTGTGISGDVTVSTVSSQDNIVLSPAQTLADNTVLTFGTFSSSQVNKTVYHYGTSQTWTTLGTSTASNTAKVRHFTFNFTGDEKTVFVDGRGYPAIYNSNGNTMTFMSSSNSTDIEGTDIAVIFKNTGFYAKDNIIFFTAPATIDDFSVANGAGSINVASNITGMIVFRDQLIVFTRDSIKRLVGNTASDFVLEPITDKIGCLNPDTIQEFGGDIIYLSPDGVRLLGATDRIGDFALDVASDTIFKDAKEFIANTNTFCSVLVRNKAQYRIFEYRSAVQSSNSKGLIATKFVSQGGSGINWSTTKGLKVYAADSVYSGSNEVIMFGNDDGYCYLMDSGNSFDGSNIEAIYESPYMAITDPQLRKTLYKLTLYAEPTGRMNLDVNFKLDFESENDLAIVQPPTINIGTPASATVTALVNGATTSSTLVSLVSNVGTIEVGQTVVGSGISGTVKVTGVTNQQNIVLDTAVSLADLTSLTFIAPTSSGVFLYGVASSVFGVATFSGTLDKIYKENVIGSFKTVAMRITDNSLNPTFTLDTAVLEYRQHDRQ